MARGSGLAIRQYEPHLVASCDELHCEQVRWGFKCCVTMVLPMTPTQTKPEPARLSHQEAEELRALLHSTRVAEMDALARLRTGGLITSASNLRAARRRTATRQVPSLRSVRTLTA